MQAEPAILITESTVTESPPIVPSEVDRTHALDFRSAVVATKDLRPHLDYLDGIRGISALYVAAFHTSLIVMFRTHAGRDLPGALRIAFRVLHFGFLNYGHLAVGVFIVLSGYCLMLPLASNPTLELRGGAARFLERRARRIFPAYYSALALTLAAMYLVPSLTKIHGNRWDIAQPPFSPLDLGAHLVMLQNFRSKAGIDAPMWSVALECQIYVIFTLLLLPAFRRGGIAALIAVAALVSVVPQIAAAHVAARLCPWFVGLFAMGMIAATCTHGPGARAKSLTRIAEWCAGISVALLVCQQALKFNRVASLHTLRWLRIDFMRSEFALDAVLGIAVFGALVALGLTLQFGGSWRCAAIIRCLELPALTRLGRISYSLYLVHAPILLIVTRWADVYTRGGAVTALICVAVGLPLCLAAAATLSRHVEYIAVRSKPSASRACAP